MKTSAISIQHKIVAILLLYTTIKIKSVKNIYIYTHIHLQRTNPNLELFGIVKFPDCMASVLSPNGNVKKQSLYNKHPNA